MPLPGTIRVKLSSEAAGSIALTPVVVQEMTPAELVGWMVPVMGKDVERIRAVFARGSVVIGASRFRWEGFAAQREEVEALLL